MKRFRPPREAFPVLRDATRGIWDGFRRAWKSGSTEPEPAIEPRHVQYGTSSARRADKALTEALRNIDLADTCFALLFVPNRFDVSKLVTEAERMFEGVPVFGCTTAGQICARGYDLDRLLVIAFPKANFRCSSILLKDLPSQSVGDVALAIERHDRQFRHTAGWGRFALLFVDGLSKNEDILISTLDTVMGDVPVFGGSAGDGLRFEETFVIHNKEAHKDSAVVLLIETRLGFKGLSFDHFLPTDTQVFITRADPDKRLAFEINGAPAAPEYARLVGCDVSQLCPEVFAENPMLIRYRTNHYVRAIQDVAEEDALSFMAAIDDGLIMTLGKGREVTETLRAQLEGAAQDGKEPDFILGFDCVLRKLEFENKGLTDKTSAILGAHRVLGFSTYGEQHRGVHMNQTFVGVAFFDPEEGVSF